MTSGESEKSTDPYTDLHVKLLQIKGIAGLLTIITAEDLANAPSDSLNQTAWAINDRLDDALNLLDNLHHRSLQA